MKITFLRLGYANNSSSSHSLIFTNEPLKTDEYKGFGWRHFTAADKKSKLNYLLICLKYSFNNFLNINRYDNLYLDHKEVENMISRQFKKFLLSLGFLEDEIDEAVLLENLDDYNCYVDHQSVITFPSYRDIKRGLNKEFAKALIDEIVNNQYAFLGGNDNGDENHPCLDLDLPESQDVKILIKFLIDQDPQEILCEKDSKTNEWVISQVSGSIIKILL